MRRIRGAAAGVFVAGLVLGTLGDERTESVPQRERGGGAWVLQADFHVHAFFGDLGLAPWDLQREAQRARLDVLAVTNHGGLLGARVNDWWSRRTGGPLVLIGQEVTAPGYHLIAAGIERAVDADQEAGDAIRDVHAQGGVAIAAHPSSAYAAGWNDAAMARLDGVEVAHPDMHVREGARGGFAAFHRRTRAVNDGVAPIGSSDFHIVRPLGITRTYVLAEDYSREGVIDAVRRGRTVAADRDGHLYGEPSLVARVLAHRDATGDSGRQPDSLMARAGMLLAWGGLLVTVLLDGGRQTAALTGRPGPR